MIRALLYRLLIISAHLQRHGIRLLIAIGRFNARAAAFGADPPAPFDSTNLPLLCLSFVALLHPPLPLLFPLDFFSMVAPSPRFGLLLSKPITIICVGGQGPTSSPTNCPTRREEDEKFRETRGTRELFSLSENLAGKKGLKGIGRNLQEVGQETNESR